MSKVSLNVMAAIDSRKKSKKVRDKIPVLKVNVTDIKKRKQTL